MLTQACWLLERQAVNIYPDSLCAFSIVHDLGILGQQRVFLVLFFFFYIFPGTPRKNEQQVHNLLTAVLLLSEFVVIRIEAHAKETEPEHQGNAPADCPGKAAPTESTKMVVHVDRVCSAFAKNDPPSKNLAILRSL